MNVNKKTIYRILVLSEYIENYQKRAAEIIILDIINKISSFFNLNVIDNFRAEFENLIYKAMIFWWLTQRCLYKIESSIEKEKG
jgi:hypothetical protein